MVGRFGLADIKLTEESVDITWTDGHDSTYNFKYLRVNCGCAECVKEVNDGSHSWIEVYYGCGKRII